jgi:hypothetical protein
MNENCLWCGGAGRILKEEQPAPPAKTKNGPQAHVFDWEYRKCPECGARVLAYELIEHRISRHDYSLKPNAPRVKKKSRRHNRKKGKD